MRGLIEHSCKSCGDTAELAFPKAGWVCPSCTQTADLKDSLWNYAGHGDSFA